MARTSTKTVEERIAVAEAKHANKIAQLREIATLEASYRDERELLDARLKMDIAAVKNQVYETTTDTQEMI